MRAISFFRTILVKFPFLLISTTVLLVLTTLVDALSIFSLAPVIDYFLDPDMLTSSDITSKAISALSYFGIPTTLVSFLVVFLGFNVVKNAFHIFAQHSILRTKYSFLRDLYVGTFEEFFNAQWSFFRTGKQGTLLNTFIRETTVVGDAFGAMARFAASIIQIILFLAVPFYLSWQVTSITLVVALLFAWPFLLFGKISYRFGKLNTFTGNLLSNRLQESLGSAKVILGFGNQQQSVENLDRAFNAHRQATLKSQTLGIAIQNTYYPLGLSVLIVALFLARHLAVPLSETAVLIYALLKVVPSIGGLAAQKNSLDNFFPSYEQVVELRQRAKQLKQRTGTMLFRGFHEEIAIERLSFAYDSQDSTLVDLNISIPKGEMVAIAGRSGAGKSTLIDMIMGFNEALAGQITIDGVPLYNFDICSYRQRLGYVPQDSVLFNMTIRDNLLWANEHATGDDIQRACRLANAEEFIGEFLEGYDTMVGDRGVRLSGGQAQRVALARAILRKPELLILDEATSSLDTHSERLIQQAIESIAEETTVIVIAHRLSTIVRADRVYLLEKGRVVEEGTYPDLVNSSGRFSQMVELQELRDQDYSNSASHPVEPSNPRMLEIK